MSCYFPSFIKNRHSACEVNPFRQILSNKRGSLQIVIIQVDLLLSFHGQDLVKSPSGILFSCYIL